MQCENALILIGKTIMFSSGCSIRNNYDQLPLAPLSLLPLMLFTVWAEPNAFFQWPLVLVPISMNDLIVVCRIKEKGSITLLAVIPATLRSTKYVPQSAPWKKLYNISPELLSITSHPCRIPFKDTCPLLFVPKNTEDFGKWQALFGRFFTSEGCGHSLLLESVLLFSISEPHMD